MELLRKCKEHEWWKIAGTYYCVPATLPAVLERLTRHDPLVEKFKLPYYTHPDGHVMVGPELKEHKRKIRDVAEVLESIANGA